MKLPLAKEHQAKYLILSSWVADKTGLTEEVIESIVNDAYEKHLRKDLEDYCDKLLEEEEVNE